MDFLQAKPSAEFQDRLGIVHPIYKVVAWRHDEFWERWQVIEARIDRATEEETWQSIYLNDLQVQHCIHECLRLCGIDKEWVDFDLLEELLICRKDALGNPHPGTLLQINTLKKREPIGESGFTVEGLTSLIALGSLKLGSAEEAVKLLCTLPLQDYLDFLDKRDEMIIQSDPEAKAKAEQQHNMEMARKALDQILLIPDEELGEAAFGDVTFSRRLP